jgi:hypothetical protein
VGSREIGEAYGGKGGMGQVIDDVVYDTSFNANEWLVIVLAVIGFGAIFLFPRPFSPLQTAFHFLIGIGFGLIFDHTIAVPPFEFYDVGDQSRYQVFDMFSYIMYAPFGYWFIYVYKRLRLYGFYTIFYILLWACFGLGVEAVSSYLGVFHYRNGYRLDYSFPIYLMVLSIDLWLYRAMFAPERHSSRVLEKNH